MSYVDNTRRSPESWDVVYCASAGIYNHILGNNLWASLHVCRKLEEGDLIESGSKRHAPIQSGRRINLAGLMYLIRDNNR